MLMFYAFKEDERNEGKGARGGRKKGGKGKEREGTRQKQEVMGQWNLKWNTNRNQ